MKHLCLECLNIELDGPTCACGGRVISHPEFFDLTIAHIDADAFYASVEKRDNPSLRDKPVIIGGEGNRSVVATACYIAREYGVRSAQSAFQAKLNCPNGVFLKPRFERYREVSNAIREMMAELTPQVQTVSLDEAYLDLSGTSALHGAPPAVVLARLARRVRDELGVTVSIGLSHAKYLAKIASDLEKPRGFSVIGKAETRKFLEDKPVGLIGGVGARTQQVLRDIGVRTIGDLRSVEPRLLERRVGSHAQQLIGFAYGVDRRKIEPNAEAKSISAETTFEKDIFAIEDLERAVWPLCEKVSTRAKTGKVVGDTVSLKLKQYDHKVLTRQMHLDEPTQLAEELYQVARLLLKKAPAGMAFRLVGIGISGLEDDSDLMSQSSLFDDGSQKREAVERALDEVRAKWGNDVVFKGRSLKS